MKKIIIVSDSLRIGGIQQALKNLLHIIEYDDFKIDLFLFNHSSSDIGKLNNNIKLIKSSKILDISTSTGNEAKIKGLFYYTIRKFIAILCYIFGSNKVFSYLFKFERNMNSYDYAISFSNNINNRSVYFGQNKFVLEKVNATRKYTWLHVDYDEMKLNNEVNKREYEKFDKIICVSEAVKNAFIKNYPYLGDKCRVIYNYIDCDKVKELSNEYGISFKSCFNIVSVGRLDENKSPLSYITVANQIKKHKINFHWWIIGNGPQMGMIKNQIVNYGLEDYVTLTGELANPYPYVANADLFVSASFSESFGIAIVESLCLNTPVISRYFPAITEYLTNNYDGLIIYGDDLDFAKEIISLIGNEEKYKYIKNNTQFKINKCDTINKFESILNEEDNDEYNDKN